MPRKPVQRLPHRRTEVKGAGRGTPADRLIRAWLDGDDAAFEDLAEALIAEGREGVLTAALRKLSEKYETEAVEEFADTLMELAEAVTGQDAFALAALVLLPIMAAGPPPDPAPLASGLARSGAFPPEAEAVFAQGWRAAEAVRSLSPCTIRRVLLDVAGGRPPADLPVQPADSMRNGGIAVLVGAMIFRTEPPQVDPEADPEALTAADEAQADQQLAAFNRWRASLDPETAKGVLILPLCSPSDLTAEITEFLDEVEEAAPLLGEIIDFVETAKAEAGGEEVMARLLARDDAVEVAVLTRSGRALDSRTFDLGDSGLMADDIERVVKASMPIEPGAG
jgi:hypothetical protein